MLSQQEWEARDALGIAELVKSGEINAREAVETAIARIEQLNPVINAVVYQAFDNALELANRQKPTGPFAGVPYLLKDLNAPAQGLPLTNGSRLLADCARHLRFHAGGPPQAAGFIILGRTNSPEFGLNITTEPVAYGATRNPWQLDRIAGGSSGGSAAAVASGMVPAAHATDSGGSIRIPAACNGLVGLKPSRGLNPTGPHRAQANEGISHENLVSRSVRDTAAILDVTSGPDAGAPYFFRKPPIGFLKAIQQRGKPMRIALMTKTFTGEPVCADAREAVERAGSLLTEMGHHVEEAAPHFDFELLQKTIFSILFANLAAAVGEFEQQRGSPAARRTNSSRCRGRRIERGRAMTLAEYFAAIAQLNRQVRRIGAFFEAQDILVTPVLAADLPPNSAACPPTAATSTRTSRGCWASRRSRCRSTAPGNRRSACRCTGRRAGCRWASSSSASSGQDAALLHLAARLEEARDWFQRRPTLRETQPRSRVAVRRRVARTSSRQSQRDPAIRATSAPPVRGR